MIRVGLIGVTPGRSWATMSHIPALQALPEFEIAGVANSSEQSAKAAAEECGLPRAYASVAEMVADPAVDLVAITVKVPHHRTLVEQAVGAGKDVYCEWPLGNGLAEAEAMAALARDAGVRTIAGMQARSSPMVRYLRDLIAEGYLGTVLSTTLVGSGMSWGAVVNQPHAYTHDRRNGATLTTIPLGHTLDALRHVLGDIRSVSATTATRRPSSIVIETEETLPMQVDDQVAFTADLQSGAVLATHYRGGVSRGTNFRWEINGTDGDIVVTGPAGHLQMFDFELTGSHGSDEAMQPLPIPAKYRTVPGSLSGFAVNVGEVYSAYARNDAGPDRAADFADAVDNHRVVDAIERSARSGERTAVEDAQR